MNNATNTGRRPTRLVAKLSGLRMLPNQNGSHVCVATCPDCLAEHPLTLGGWTAIVCNGCSAELYRSRSALNSQPTHAPTRFGNRAEWAQTQPKITE